MLNADALNQLRQLKTDIKQNKVVFPGTVKSTNGRFGFVALDEGRDVSPVIPRACPDVRGMALRCQWASAQLRTSSTVERARVGSGCWPRA